MENRNGAKENKVEIRTEETNGDYQLIAVLENG